MADSITECHLSVMSQQPQQETKRVLYMPLYMHGTCLDLYPPLYIAIADFGPLGPWYIGSTL